MTEIVKSIKIATTAETEKIIGNTTSYLNSHNGSLLHSMEIVLGENIQLTEEFKSEFDMGLLVKTAIRLSLETLITTQVLDKIKSSLEVHNLSRDIIVKLVKRQRAMELNFIAKMDRDFRMKTKEANETIESIVILLYC